MSWLLDAEPAAIELARGHPGVPILVRSHLAENRFAVELSQPTWKVRAGIAAVEASGELAERVRLTGLPDELSEALATVARRHGWPCERASSHAEAAADAGTQSRAAIEVLADEALATPDRLICAMRSGCVCVTIGHGVHEELIEAEVDGLVATAEGAADLLERAIADPAWRATLSSAAQHTALAHTPAAGALSLAVGLRSARVFGW